MPMRLDALLIPGCALVRSQVIGDDRGSFLKVFRRTSLAAEGFQLTWPEVYTSTSHKGVIRGMHFQTPPADHEKLVFCLSGEIDDVVLDLRRGSPTFGDHLKVPLRADGTGVLVPRGCAHGFLARSPDAMMLYCVATEHVPDNDKGVRWDSFGCDWGEAAPTISARDRALPPLAAFDTPFVYRADR